jgi:hypothetical protein
VARQQDAGDFVGTMYCSLQWQAGAEVGGSSQKHQTRPRLLGQDHVDKEQLPLLLLFLMEILLQVVIRFQVVIHMIHFDKS